MTTGSSGAVASIGMADSAILCLVRLNSNTVVISRGVSPGSSAAISLLTAKSVITGDICSLDTEQNVCLAVISDRSGPGPRNVRKREHRRSRLTQAPEPSGRINHKPCLVSALGSSPNGMPTLLTILLIWGTAQIPTSRQTASHCLGSEKFLVKTSAACNDEGTYSTVNCPALHFSWMEAMDTP